MATAPLSNLTALWNSIGTTFSAIKMNVTDTASAAASLLLDLQVGGVSQFRVSKGGRIVADTLTIGRGGQTAVTTNTALGFEALNSASLTGTNNTGVGYQALVATTTNGFNTALGAFALTSQTTGPYNVAIGVEAMRTSTTSTNNTVAGFGAGYSNTTGSSNIAIGSDAFYRNTTGSNSTVVGTQALFRFRGNTNTAIGYQALYGGSATIADNSGTNNIAIGYQAGDAITSGSTNLVIGHAVDVDSATASNQINIADRYFHDRIRLLERTSDPAKPTEGNMIVWLSDGTGLGDDGDVIISSTAGGVTNYAILFDHSAGTLWP